MDREYHIIKDDYDKETKKNVTIINTPLGYFKGVATLHPDDIDFESRSYGSRKSYQKAYLKFLKKKVSKGKSELKILESCYSVLSSIHDVSQDSAEMFRFRNYIKGKYKVLDRDILNYKTVRDFIKKDNTTHVEDVINYRKKVKEKNKCLKN